MLLFSLQRSLHAPQPERTAGEAIVQGRPWSSTFAECDLRHVRPHEVGSTLYTTARIVRRLIWSSDPAMADDYFETALAVALFLYLAAMIIIQSLL